MVEVVGGLGILSNIQGLEKDKKQITVGNRVLEYDPNTGAYSEVLPQGGAGTTGDVSSWAQLISTGKAKLSDVPAELKTAVAGAVSALPPGEDLAKTRSFDQASTALTSIDDALKLLDNPDAMNLSETSFGRTVGKYLPFGTSATDLTGSLDTVKALIGFDQLQKMREASPTGGALGQVSERELNFLQSVAGSLNEKQTTEKLVETLGKIRQSFEILRLVSAPDGDVFDLNGVQYTKQGDQLVPAGSESFSKVGGDTITASNIPQRNNNPGNLKKGGIADKLATGVDEYGHLQFPDAETGFKALEQDIKAKLTGNSSVVKKGPTIAELGKVYAEDPNWAKAVADILGTSVTSKASSVSLDDLVNAIAIQEGFYA